MNKHARADSVPIPFIDLAAQRRHRERLRVPPALDADELGRGTAFERGSARARKLPPRGECDRADDCNERERSRGERARLHSETRVHVCV